MQYDLQTEAYRGEHYAEERIAITAGQPKWQATVTYRCETALTGEVQTTFLMADLTALQPYVARGPHWDAIIDIRVKRINVFHPELAIEEDNLV